MASLTLEQIRAMKSALPRKAVEVPELGTVTIRGLTLREVGEINKLQKTSPNEPLLVNAKAIELSAVNDDGSPMFVGEDVKLILDAIPFAAIKTLSKAVLVFNHMLGDLDDPKES